MDRVEFAKTMAYLAAGIGKPIDSMTAEVYFDLLQDLPPPALQVAAKQAILETEYPVIPLPGELRKRALAAMAGPQELTPIDAWGVFLRALRHHGYNQQEEGLASLPPLVRQVATSMGWQECCESTKPDVLRAQFCKAFELTLARQQGDRLLPPALRELIGQVAEATNASKPRQVPIPVAATVRALPAVRAKRPPLLRLVVAQVVDAADSEKPRPPTAEELDRMRRGLQPRPEPGEKTA